MKTETNFMMAQIRNGASTIAIARISGDPRPQVGHSDIHDMRT